MCQWQNSSRAFSSPEALCIYVWGQMARLPLPFPWPFILKPKRKVCCLTRNIQLGRSLLKRLFLNTTSSAIISNIVLHPITECLYCPHYNLPIPLGEGTNASLQYTKKEFNAEYQIFRNVCCQLKLRPKAEVKHSSANYTILEQNSLAVNIICNHHPIIFRILWI